MLSLFKRSPLLRFDDVFADDPCDSAIPVSTASAGREHPLTDRTRCDSDAPG
ncbi:hypothetical protein ABMC89_03080 [Sulfitobacter sp. HNIBRBA3233]|uniref:hypothetical protein n=1 Tax=Sulfitobacter marinivivus TaxID=3158558 RepID=UPI0032E009FB